MSIKRVICIVVSAQLISNGDAVVAWAVDAEIKLIVVNRLTGDFIENQIPTPDCHSGLLVSLLLGQGKDGKVLLFGSPTAFPDDKASFCVRMESILFTD